MNLLGAITQSDLATVLDLSEARVSQLASDGLFPAGQSGMQWVHNYVRRIRDQAAGRASEESLNLMVERAALAREQRIGIELKNQIARREYAPRSMLKELLATASQSIVLTMTTALAKYEAARAALAAAHRVDEVKSIRDKAQAMAAYAKQARDTQLVQYATEIKVRAERRCGEMLRDAAENGQRATKDSGQNQHDRVSHDATPTLRDLGITRDQSSRYQKLAAMPAEHFEAAVARVRLPQRCADAVEAWLGTP